MFDKDFLSQICQQQHRETFAKIIALTFDEYPVETLEGKITTGSINVDGNSAVRRTCNLTVVFQDIKIHDYYWGIKTKIRLYIGLKNNINDNYPDIIWFNQGIFVINTFNISYATNNATITISGKDKMCLLNGDLGGQLFASIDFGKLEEYNNKYFLVEELTKQNYKSHTYYFKYQIVWNEKDNFLEAYQNFENNFIKYYNLISNDNLKKLEASIQKDLEEESEDEGLFDIYPILKQVGETYFKNKQFLKLKKILDQYKKLLLNEYIEYIIAEGCYNEENDLSSIKSNYLLSLEKQEYYNELYGKDNWTLQLISPEFKYINLDVTDYLSDMYIAKILDKDTRMFNYYADLRKKKYDKYLKYIEDTINIETKQNFEKLILSSELIKQIFSNPNSSDGDTDWAQCLQDFSSDQDNIFEEKYPHLSTIDKNNVVKIIKIIRAAKIRAWLKREYRLKDLYRWYPDTTNYNILHYHEDDDFLNELVEQKLLYHLKKEYQIFYLTNSRIEENYLEEVIVPEDKKFKEWLIEEENQDFPYTTNLKAYYFKSINEKDYYRFEQNLVLTEIPLKRIIREAVHTYAKEPYHNIIINDLDDYGLEQFQYKGENPLYLLNDIQNNVIDNIYFNGDKVVYLADTYEEKKLSDFLNNSNGVVAAALTERLIDDTVNATKITLTLPEDNSNPSQYTVSVLNYGDDLGYRVTELIYAGDLISTIGENLTSILDKIKNMLGNFEYFYDIDGHFIFQKKKTYVETNWSALTKDSEGESYILPAKCENSIAYVFNNMNYNTAIANNPALNNVKNDYIVWGTRKSTTSGANDLPIHARFVIEKKPVFYQNYERNCIYISDTIEKSELNAIQKIYSSEDYMYKEVDWREIIYQMARDYQNHQGEDIFLSTIRKNNLNYYPTGYTGYEPYYTDFLGFWRQLYNPYYTPEIIYSSGEYITQKEPLATFKYLQWDGRYIDQEIYNSQFLYSGEDLLNRQKILKKERDYYINTFELKDNFGSTERLFEIVSGKYGPNNLNAFEIDWKNEILKKIAGEESNSNLTLLECEAIRFLKLGFLWYLKNYQPSNVLFVNYTSEKVNQEIDNYLDDYLDNNYLTGSQGIGKQVKLLCDLIKNNNFTGDPIVVCNMLRLLEDDSLYYYKNNDKENFPSELYDKSLLAAPSKDDFLLTLVNQPSYNIYPAIPQSIGITQNDVIQTFSNSRWYKKVNNKSYKQFYPITLKDVQDLYIETDNRDIENITLQSIEITLEDDYALKMYQDFVSQNKDIEGIIKVEDNYKDRYNQIISSLNINTISADRLLDIFYKLKEKGILVSDVDWFKQMELIKNYDNAVILNDLTLEEAKFIRNLKIADKRHNINYIPESDEELEKYYTSDEIKILKFLHNINGGYSANILFWCLQYLGINKEALFYENSVVNSLDDLLDISKCPLNPWYLNKYNFKQIISVYTRKEYHPLVFIRNVSLGEKNFQPIDVLELTENQFQQYQNLGYEWYYEGKPVIYKNFYPNSWDEIIKLLNEGNDIYFKQKVSNEESEDYLLELTSLIFYTDDQEYYTKENFDLYSWYYADSNIEKYVKEEEIWKKPKIEDIFCEYYIVNYKVPEEIQDLKNWKDYNITGQKKLHYDNDLNNLSQAIVSENSQRKYWNLNVFKAPETLNFWIDFLDNGDLSQFNVSQIGSRAKVVNDNKVTSIYFKEVPNIIITSNETAVNDFAAKGDGYTYIFLPDDMKGLFSISYRGKSAKTMIDELIYQFGYCIENITLTVLPMYYLEPNTRIKVKDDNIEINGEYIITKLTIPLTYNGTMQITANNAPMPIF